LIAFIDTELVLVAHGFVVGAVVVWEGGVDGDEDGDSEIADEGPGIIVGQEPRQNCVGVIG